MACTLESRLLKDLKTTVNLATTRDKLQQRSWGFLPKARTVLGWLSQRRQQQFARVPGMHRWTASKATPDLFRTEIMLDSSGVAGNVIMNEGSNEAAQPGRFSLKEVESDSNRERPDDETP